MKCVAIMIRAHREARMYCGVKDEKDKYII